MLKKAITDNINYKDAGMEGNVSPHYVPFGPVTLHQPGLAAPCGAHTSSPRSGLLPVVSRRAELLHRPPPHALRTVISPPFGLNQDPPWGGGGGGG